MVEKEKKNNVITELGFGLFVKVLNSGYPNGTIHSVKNMVRYNIIIPSQYEPGGKKVYSPRDLLRAACALEIKAVNDRWKDVTASIGSSVNSTIRNEVRASKEWKSVYGYAKKIGVNVSDYKNLAPINEE